MTVPKPPAFDAAAHDRAHVDNIKKPNGSPYLALSQFAPWKQWVDKLRDHLEALRVAVFGPDGIKKHVDRNTARIAQLEEDVRVLKEAPAPRPFP